MQNILNTMKPIIPTLALLATLQMANAQERLPREEALRYAAAVTANAGQLTGTAIATSVDPGQPVALSDGEYGGLVLPQKGLTAERIAALQDQEVAPLGLLWLYRLAPLRYGQPVAADKLRLVTVYADGDYATVPQCALGVRRTSNSELEMVVFGKNAEPILAVPLKASNTAQATPLDMTATRDYDAGRVTIKILGRYQATFGVTELLL